MADQLPVAGGTIVQGPGGRYGPSTGTHSDFGNWESDNAVDISVPVGTPVYAVQAGTIGPQFGSLGSSGQLAGLRLHLNGAKGSQYYAHLSAYAPGIAPGVHVDAGQLLGYSGEANGVAHLHFAVSSGSPFAWVAGLPSKVAEAVTPDAASADGSSSGGGMPAALTSAGCGTILLAAGAGAIVSWTFGGWQGSLVALAGLLGAKH